MSAKLMLHVLDDRRLMATGILSGLTSDGYLLVAGTTGADAIAIYQEGTQIKVDGASVSSFPAAGVKGVVVAAGPGDDVVSLSGVTAAGLTRQVVNVPALVFGEAGADILVGGAKADILVGGAGNDLLAGQAGNDVLIGGTGFDLAVGGAGADIMLDEFLGGFLNDAAPEDQYVFVSPPSAPPKAINPWTFTPGVDQNGYATVNGTTVTNGNGLQLMGIPLFAF